MILSIAVPGTPIPQGSKRVVRGHLIDANAKTLRPWRASIAAAAADAMNAGGHDTVTVPVSVTIYATFPRPKAHYRSNGELKPNAPNRHATRPDIDKVARAVLDALTDAGVWRDDAQVAGLMVRKAYGHRPGLVVEVAG